MAVASGDHLIKKVGGLLVERQIPELVADKQRRLRISSELSYHGVINLRSEQVIEHVHGGSEENPLIGLAGTPGDHLRQKCFPHAGIADQHDIGSFGEEREIEQP